MAISLAEAKSLCTASELALVKASTRNEIGKLSAAQLRQKIARARQLRDKWSDQAQRQRRATQIAQRSRQTSVGTRSAEKAALFAEVLERFETQLAKLDAKAQVGGAAPNRMPHRARSATHRATRAVVRSSLQESRLELGAQKKPAKPTRATPKMAPTPAPANAEVAAPTEGKVIAKPTVPMKKSGPGKTTAAGIGMSALESARTLQGLRVTKGKQRSAVTAAKQDRFKAGGFIRIQKNASARNKRRQGKRDSR